MNIVSALYYMTLTLYDFCWFGMCKFVFISRYLLIAEKRAYKRYKNVHRKNNSLKNALIFPHSNMTSKRTLKEFSRKI